MRTFQSQWRVGTQGNERNPSDGHHNRFNGRDDLQQFQELINKAIDIYIYYCATCVALPTLRTTLRLEPPRLLHI